MTQHKPKWTWKNGRLWHPTEPMSLNINEAYHMSDKNDDIAEACDGVLCTYNRIRDGLSEDRRMNNGK
jgi:hypothetical protein